MYLKEINGVWTPFSLKQLREENPNVSFPKTPGDSLLAEYGMFPCVEAEVPTVVGPNQIAERDPEPLRQPDGSYVWNWYLRTKTPEELAEDLIEERASMRCSPMQGKLALGEAVWTQVEVYRDNQASWTERIIIDSALDWDRNSQNIAFFQQLLGMTDAQVDNLFRLAKTF